MSDANPEAAGAAPRELTPLEKFWISPASIYLDVAVRCPSGDMSNIRKLATLMWLCWLWQCVLFSNTARIMLSPDGEWKIEHIALAMLVATILLVADAVIFIGAAWHLHGLAELSRFGFELRMSPGARLKNNLPIAGRFVIALLIANVMGVVTGLSAFQNDVRIIIERTYQQRNAPLFAQAAARVDDELVRSVAAQNELGHTIAASEDEARRLRQEIVEPSANEPELKLALDEVARAQAAKTKADAELGAAQKDSADELGGTCRPGLSCVPGDGPRWRAAQERITHASQNTGVAGEALRDAQTRLRQLQEGKTSELRRKTGAAELHLAEVMKAKREQETQLVSITDAYQQRLAERERHIRETVESDPRHVARDQGLLARLRALNELMADRSVATLVYLFDGIFMLLELAAVVGKTIGFVPMTYATVLAEADLIRAYETVQRLEHVIHGGPAPDRIKDGEPPVEEAPPEEPEPVSPPPQPPPPDTPAGAEMPVEQKPEPKEAAAEVPPPPIKRPRGRPRGPNWRPPVSASTRNDASSEPLPPVPERSSEMAVTPPPAPPHLAGRPDEGPPHV